MTFRPRRPAPRSTRLAAAAALALAPLLALSLAACGGDDDDGGASGTTAPAEEAGGACALITADEASELFGASASVVPPAGDDPTACLWEAAEGDGEFPTRHQLQLSVFDDDTPLDASTYGPDAQAIDGLGDEAFVVPDGFLGTTAAYRAGSQTVVLTYAIIAGEDGPDSAEQADDVVDLLRTVEQRSG